MSDTTTTYLTGLTGLTGLIDQDTAAIQYFIRHVLQRIEDAKDFDEPSLKFIIPRELKHLKPYNKRFVERAVMQQLIVMNFEVSEPDESGQFEVLWKKAATTKHCCITS